MVDLDLSPLGVLPNVTLKKITLNYISEQDRLRLLAAGDDENVYLFWVTRRLLKFLIDHLEKKFSPSPKLTAHQRLVNSLMLETQAQSAVQNRDMHSSHVSSNNFKETFLITSVDVTLTEAAVSLVWRSSATQFELKLSNDEFFQWVFAMRSTLSDADWKIAWPEWIENADVSKTENRRSTNEFH